jgi:putative transposase
LIGEADRRQALALIEEACAAGCRKAKACEMLGLTMRTVQRWERQGLADQRQGSRAVPANRLSGLEREQIKAVMNSPAYRDLSPHQIVPQLADQGRYLGSESSFYRILRQENMNHHRQPSRPATHRRPPPQTATAPNQVWTWDITYLAWVIRGKFLYLYMIIDLYSRKIGAWQVHDRECSELASALVTEACYVEGVARHELVLHSDNGSPMKGATLLATLKNLGVMPSFSRPSVSNDNPYSESLFRTLKYRPWYPEKPFQGLDDARQWVEQFVYWYNHVHQHSALRFVTPHQRHTGQDHHILAQRHELYQTARERHPERWSGPTRNWEPVAEVHLNKANHSSEPPTPDRSSTNTD